MSGPILCNRIAQSTSTFDVSTSVIRIKITTL
ncbi:hypothetical protein ACJIZ3_014371 [Penstemon smallii]|uniref:Uncharacterized protein n=1 Tax=Penstemon smallii TaxID=265156 RepID=A0ABD3RJR0_9LAMI